MKTVELSKSGFDKGVAAGGGYEYKIIENGVEYEYLGWHMSAPCRLVVPGIGQIDQIGDWEEKILSPEVPMAQVLDEIYSLPKINPGRTLYKAYIDVDTGEAYHGKDAILLENKVEELKSYLAFDEERLVVVHVVEVKIESLYEIYQKEVDKAIEILQKKIKTSQIWLGGEQDSCYNHTDWIVVKGVKVVSLAYQTYGLNTPRHWVGLGDYKEEDIISMVEEVIKDPESDYNKALKAEAAKKAAEAKRVKKILKAAKAGNYYHPDAPIAAFELIEKWQSAGAKKLSKRLAKKANKHFAWGHVFNVIDDKMRKGGEYYHHGHCLFVYQWALSLYTK